MDRISYSSSNVSVHNVDPHDIFRVGEIAVCTVITKVNQF